jgi:hypothetical protein
MERQAIYHLHRTLPFMTFFPVSFLPTRTKLVLLWGLHILYSARYKSGGALPGIWGNGVSSGEGGEGGPGPPNKEGDKQSNPSEEGGNMEQEEAGRNESGVMKRNQREQSEHLQKRLFNNVIECTSMMLKLMLRLFQENKSICIHPLMSRHCTSLCHVWHSMYYFSSYTPSALCV